MRHHQMMGTVIRAATTDDIELARAIEVDAGERFRSIGMSTIADDDPPSTAELADHVADGSAWVAELDDRVVGYAVASVVDAEGHLDQVSVSSAAAGQGIGRQLVECVLAWAARQGVEAVTLTTFRDVPWNGPYYERLGFARLGEHELGPELAAIRGAERARGLDLAPRVAMRYVLERG